MDVFWGNFSLAEIFCFGNERVRDASGNPFGVRGRPKAAPEPRKIAAGQPGDGETKVSLNHQIFPPAQRPKKYNLSSLNVLNALNGSNKKSALRRILKCLL